MTDLTIWGVKNKEDWRMSHWFFWNLRTGWTEQRREEDTTTYIPNTQHGGQYNEGIHSLNAC